MWSTLLLALWLTGLLQAQAQEVWSPAGGGRLRTTESDSPELDRQISTVRALLDNADAELSKEEQMNYWRAYALLLQNKDSRQMIPQQ